MANNSQSRKWQLTINNPQNVGITHEYIKMQAMRFIPDYYCLSDEIGDTGNYHTHLFIYSSSPIRFSTLKERFPIAHIEKAYGTVKENRDYITKNGKWEETEKAETKVEGTFEEWGNMPEEKAEKNPITYGLIQEIYAGKRTAEIVTETPSLAFRVRDIDTLRQTLLADKYSKELRNLEVTYLWGATGTGKTKGIYKNFSANEIFRITNYRNGTLYCDGYCGQDVLVLEEFYSQIPIEELLNILDIYPLMLPARYSDKVACYTKVFITSNISLDMQYIDVQNSRPETYKALLRRIHHIKEYKSDGKIVNQKGEV